MKKRVSIYIEEDIHKKFKIQCIKEGTNISKKIEEILKKEVEETNERIEK